MSGTTEPSGTASDRDAAPDAATGETMPDAPAAVADGSAAAPEAATGPVSLNALLGGSFEGGAACAADGTCD